MKPSFPAGSGLEPPLTDQEVLRDILIGIMQMQECTIGADRKTASEAREAIVQLEYVTYALKVISADFALTESQQRALENLWMQSPTKTKMDSVKMRLQQIAERATPPFRWEVVLPTTEPITFGQDRTALVLNVDKRRMVIDISELGHVH